MLHVSVFPYHLETFKVHNLKPQWRRVKNILQFERCHKFYSFHDVGLWIFFYSCNAFGLFFFFVRLCCVGLVEYFVFLAYSYMYVYTLTFPGNRLIQGVWLVTLSGFQYLFGCVRLWSYYTLCAFMLTSTFVCSFGLCCVSWLVCRVVCCTPELPCVQCSYIITFINTAGDILWLI
jgi:hypothetical protein